MRSFSCKKMNLSSAKWQPFCLNQLNVSEDLQAVHINEWNVLTVPKGFSIRPGAQFIDSLFIASQISWKFRFALTYNCQTPLQWRHNGHDDVSNNQPHHCLLDRLFGAQIKENIKAPRHWPFCREFTGNRWITHTNGQWRGKCFHMMTSSWTCELTVAYFLAHGILYFGQW